MEKLATENQNPSAMDTFNAAVRSFESGDQSTAFRLMLQTVREDSGVIPAWINISEALRAAGKLNLSIQCLKKALAMSDDPMIHRQLGETLRLALRYPEAETHLLQSIAKLPMAFTWYSLSCLYMMRGEIDKALHANEKATELDPAVLDLKWQRGLLHLLNGNYKLGFELFESRMEFKIFETLSNAPLWRGESLKGKTLHVYSEQGFGDVLQFFRFLPCLTDCRVLVTLPHELRRLLENSLKLENISYYNHGLPTPAADYSLPICSLPHHLLSGPIPNKTYLFAPRVGPSIKKPKGIRTAVGVCWAGSPKHSLNHLRSSTPEAFVEALGLPGVELYSLQVGQLGTQATDPAYIGEMGLMQDLAPLIRDFADTAYLISQLDCVVCVDTAVAHLAGAMGKPCHVIIPFGALDWRWLAQGSKSPWYPSMTVHRQLEGETWGQILERIAKLL